MVLLELVAVGMVTWVVIKLARRGLTGPRRTDSMQQKWFEDLIRRARSKSD